MKNLISQTVVLLGSLVFFTAYSFADPVSRVYRDSDRNFEARLNAKDGSVSVSLLRPGKERPGAIEIAFIDGTNRATTFELTAATPPQASEAVFKGQNPRWLQSSFVGLELWIPLSKTKREKIRLSASD